MIFEITIKKDNRPGYGYWGFVSLGENGPEFGLEKAKTKSAALNSIKKAILLHLANEKNHKFIINK